jgi:C-terminal processing protease CtpA/Prc
MEPINGGDDMKFRIPQIKNTTVTTVIFNASGAVKKIWLDTHEEEIEINDVEIASDAEIQVNKILKFGGDGL